MLTTRDLFKRRAQRVRRRIQQAADGKLRLSVFRSPRQIYAQLIDDSCGRTVISASSLDRELSGRFVNGGNIAAAAEVGRLVGERATNAGLSDVVFDRGGYRHHGRVKALADAARTAGLKF